MHASIAYLGQCYAVCISMPRGVLGCVLLFPAF
jgi:hypothetical protein